MEEPARYTITQTTIGCTTLVHAKDETQRRRVTAKIVPSQGLQTFLKGEGQVLSTLKCSPHPSLPNVIGASEPSSERDGYIITPACYSDLHTYIRGKKRLDEGEAKNLFRQIVGGVAHCHNLNIVVRDIKLAKIMFKDPRFTQVVIADLDGACCVTRHSPLLSDKRGSPAYIAPEVLKARAYDGFAADVWSLGVVLYSMLTGTYPFRDNDARRLLKKLLTDSLEIPEWVSEDAQRLIRALMNRDPSGRPTCKQILSDPWLSADVHSKAVGAGSDELDEQVVPEFRQASFVSATLCGVENETYPEPKRIKVSDVSEKSQRSLYVCG